jgi:conjugative transfer pilus assembly protein TraH
MKKFKLLLVFLTLSGSCFAGVKKEMQKFFDSFSDSTNITSGSAVSDQQGGYYTAGNIVSRRKISNETIMNIDRPSIHMDCGGIDMYAGSFSFISKDQFIALTKNIQQNSLGYGFSLAMQTTVPQIKATIDTLMSYMQDINGLNINSCNASAALLGGVLPKTEESSKVLCGSIGMQKNYFSDRADARQGGSSKETSSSGENMYKKDFTTLAKEE